MSILLWIQKLYNKICINLYKKLKKELLVKKEKILNPHSKYKKVTAVYYYYNYSWLARMN